MSSKSHNLVSQTREVLIMKILSTEAANYVLFKKLPEDYSLRHSLATQITPNNCSKGVRVLLKEKTKCSGHQKISANHKKQTSQISEFITFLCIGRHRSLGSLKLSF